jgi:CRISPR system Cascade subunit CasA
MPSFNLVDEPWIPVRRRDGTLVMLGIRDVLLHAGDLRRVEDASPTVLGALHRVLLAVLHRALEGPGTARDAARWLRDGFPVTRLEAYLRRWRHRFDLFDPAHPFYQVPGLDRETQPKPWTQLLLEEGRANTTVVFGPSYRPGYRPRPGSPADVARGLVAFQTFELGGLIRVFITSAKAAPLALAAATIVIGDTLHDTLCLNLVPYTDPERDVPIWERDGVLTVSYMRTRRSMPARGHVQAYTWPSRSILLHPESDDGTIVVRQISVASGLDLAPGEAYRTDPMVAYRLAEKNGLIAIRFRTERGFWRDFASLLPGAARHSATPPQVLPHAYAVYRALGARTRTPTAMVLGLSSDQKKILLWRTELFELPQALLDDDRAYDTISGALQEAEEAGRRLAQATFALAGNLLSRNGREALAADKRNLSRSLGGTAQYWSALDFQFPALVSGLSRDEPERVVAKWFGAILRALTVGWMQNVQSAGDDALALRAVARAESALTAYTTELRERMRGDAGAA